MTVDIRKRQMNSDLNHLYQHIHSSPSVVVDIPKDIGAGRIIRTVSPSGTVISSWKMQYGKDTAVKGEVKDNFRLLFCLGDGAAWVSDRKTMRIDRNEACLILDNGETQSMCYASGAQYEFWSVAMQREQLFSLLEGYIPEPCKLISELNNKTLTITPDIREGLLGSMQLLKTCDKGFGMMRLEAHVQELAALCFDTVAGGERGRMGLRADDMSILRQIKNRIDLEPGEVPGIKELAFEYGLSASKLSRLFRQTFGIPIHSYVIESRLCEGAKLLSEGKFSVGEVSRRVGYIKQSQFSAAFKRRFHILPKDF